MVAEHCAKSVFIHHLDAGQETYVSCDLPPWFDSTMPCTPCLYASTASSTHWIPLITNGNVVILRIHASMFQSRDAETEPCSDLAIPWTSRLPMILFCSPT